MKPRKTSTWPPWRRTVVWESSYVYTTPGGSTMARSCPNTTTLWLTALFWCTASTAWSPSRKLTSWKRKSTNPGTRKRYRETRMLRWHYITSQHINHTMEVRLRRTWEHFRLVSESLPGNSGFVSDYRFNFMVFRYTVIHITSNRAMEVSKGTY